MDRVRDLSPDIQQRISGMKQVLRDRRLSVPIIVNEISLVWAMLRNERTGNGIGAGFGGEDSAEEDTGAVSADGGESGFVEKSVGGTSDSDKTSNIYGSSSADQNDTREYHRQTKQDYFLERMWLREYEALKNLSVLVVTAAAFVMRLP
jgi:hypothetical protein